MKYEKNLTENTVQRSFHSPGCNEGKARYETLGIRRQKRIELRRSGTNRSSIGALALGLCHPYGAQKCVSMPNPGLAPWAMPECRPCRAYLRFYHQSITLLF